MEQNAEHRRRPSGRSSCTQRVSSSPAFVRTVYRRTDDGGSSGGGGGGGGCGGSAEVGSRGAAAGGAAAGGALLLRPATLAVDRLAQREPRWTTISRRKYARNSFVSCCCRRRTVCESHLFCSTTPVWILSWYEKANVSHPIRLALRPSQK